MSENGEFSHVKWSTIPNPKMRKGLEIYLTTGRLPGDFLQALLSNNLIDAFGRADETNAPLLQKWCWWMHMEFPSFAWGDKATMLMYSKVRACLAQ